MKYDLRKIMNRAWVIKHKNRKNIFSLCLRMSWFEFKKDLKDKRTNSILNQFCSLKRPKYYRKNMSTSAILKMLDRNGIDIPKDISKMLD